MISKGFNFQIGIDGGVAIAVEIQTQVTVDPVRAILQANVSAGNSLALLDIDAAAQAQAAITQLPAEADPGAKAAVRSPAGVDRNSGFLGLAGDGCSGRTGRTAGQALGVMLQIAGVLLCHLLVFLHLVAELATPTVATTNAFFSHNSYRFNRKWLTIGHTRFRWSYASINSKAGLSTRREQHRNADRSLHHLTPGSRLFVQRFSLGAGLHAI